MARPLGFVNRRRRRFVSKQGAVSYRAVTLGSERQDWAVVDDGGDVVWRGDAKTAAMIATRLTKSAV